MKMLTNVSPADLRYWTEPLLEAHYQESNRCRDMKLAPDWDAYRHLHEAGRLLTVIAVEDGECLGYAVNVLSPHIHYVAQWVSQNDVIYVTPSARASTGGRLMVAMKSLSAEFSADYLIWHAKPATPLDAVLAARMPIHEHIYMEAL